MNSVVPAYEDFIFGLRDSPVQLSRNAARFKAASVSLLHLLDYAANELGSALPFKSVREYRDHLVGHHPHLAIVFDAGDAGKHHTLTRRQPVVRASAAIREHFAVVKHQDEQGPYFSIRPVVMVETTTPNEWAQADRVLHRCIGTMIYEFTQRGLLPSAMLLPPPRRWSGVVNRIRPPEKLQLHLSSRFGNPVDVGFLYMRHISENDEVVELDEPPGSAIQIETRWDVAPSDFLAEVSKEQKP